MSIAALAAFSTFTQNGLKEVFHAGQRAASQLISTNAIREPKALADIAPASSEFRPTFTYTFERRPKRTNVTTLTPTKVHAEDPSHPFHTKVNRRLDAFDPSKFYWRVHVPVDTSKKPAVRRWAMKRVREAFRLQLIARGFMRDGTRKDSKHGVPLQGALLIVLPKDPKSTLRMSYEEVESNVKWIVGKVVEAHRDTRYHQVRLERLRT